MYRCRTLFDKNIEHTILYARAPSKAGIIHFDRGGLLPVVGEAAAGRRRIIILLLLSFSSSCYSRRSLVISDITSGRNLSTVVMIPSCSMSVLLSVDHRLYAVQFFCLTFLYHGRRCLSTILLSCTTVLNCIESVLLIMNKNWIPNLISLTSSTVSHPQQLLFIIEG